MTNLSDVELPEFRAGAKYIAPMDCLIYLREDCSYRAIRLDAFRTVLLHPTEDRAVGVKLKGMRFVLERLRAILKSVGVDLSLDKVNLISLWETACTFYGDELVANADSERLKQYEKCAREMLETAGEVASSELPLAA
ncbi:MAG: hypothetical protein ACRECP_04070 [Methylocella sp.]